MRNWILSQKSKRWESNWKRHHGWSYHSLPPWPHLYSTKDKIATTKTRKKENRILLLACWDDSGGEGTCHTGLPTWVQSSIPTMKGKNWPLKVVFWLLYHILPEITTPPSFPHFLSLSFSLSQAEMPTVNSFGHSSARKCFLNMCRDQGWVPSTVKVVIK